MTGLPRGKGRGAILRRWLLAGLAPSALEAQAVFVDGPTTQPLPSITPALQVRAVGLGPGPIQYTVQIATVADYSALVLDSTFTATDTALTVQVTRPLPSEATVYWRVLARGALGAQATSVNSGARVVPPWLTLVSPNSPAGNAFDIRRPLFVWRSARVTPAAGSWRYDLEVLGAGRPELGVTSLRDTTYRPATDLQANTSYRWNVRASLGNGESVRVASVGSFVITDPPLPTTTLLYQNFPNPFPSAASFVTCFWFDVGAPGARVALDVLDLRGNLVKNIVPGSDGVSRFDAGRYGRGAAGSASNCDNRFVWDGTGTDGRTVAPGVYLARFRADGGAPTFRRIVFRGR
ncbi:MAG: hypothetical protein ACK6DR_18780 [Gemmatimonas sp.]|uniref:hypothetical protein n=1 Tax=Gemmatimonas sp. TaxID=1962908 RepID=UPI0022BDD716|nr:hypothetical protein [Gemmatimonas sp.]MCA2983488.1 hypothetical protein [Gemmatimonas sp.]MCA2986499.1 hypothetical protein [Gemmatimonas sp.]MCA2994384.1 hypothetical protein [Gemmatimonas sp.]MCE2952253.1 hypothetical protein [Gemmatimonas sp.]MCZ8012686.1 hypothetical protein [Gemmatimonas sp.]